MNTLNFILSLWAGVSIPVVLISIYAVYKSFTKKEEKKETHNPDGDKEFHDIKSIIEQQLSAKGFKAEVHEIPSDPSEAIVMCTEQLARLIQNSNKVHETWARKTLLEIGENKKDLSALIRAVDLLVRANTSLLSGTSNTSTDVEVSTDKFIHVLQFARDKYATDVSEKKIIEGIIKNVKKDYGGK